MVCLICHCECDGGVLVTHTLYPNKSPSTIISQWNVGPRLTGLKWTRMLYDIPNLTLLRY